MTIPKPEDTGPIADTWKGSALALGGGATWTTGSASADGEDRLLADRQPASGYGWR